MILDTKLKNKSIEIKLRKERVSFFKNKSLYQKLLLNYLEKNLNKKTRSISNFFKNPLKIKPSNTYDNSSLSIESFLLINSQFNLKNLKLIDYLKRNKLFLENLNKCLPQFEDLSLQGDFEVKIQDIFKEYSGIISININEEINSKNYKKTIDEYITSGLDIFLYKNNIYNFNQDTLFIKEEINTNIEMEIEVILDRIDSKSKKTISNLNEFFFLKKKTLTLRKHKNNSVIHKFKNNHSNTPQQKKELSFAQIKKISLKNNNDFLITLFEFLSKMNLDNLDFNQEIKCFHTPQRYLIYMITTLLSIKNNSLILIDNPSIYLNNNELNTFINFLQEYFKDLYILIIDANIDKKNKSIKKISFKNKLTYTKTINKNLKIDLEFNKIKYPLFSGEVVNIRRKSNFKSYDFFHHILKNEHCSNQGILFKTNFFKFNSIPSGISLGNFLKIEDEIIDFLLQLDISKSQGLKKIDFKNYIKKKDQKEIIKEITYKNLNIDDLLKIKLKSILKELPFIRKSKDLILKLDQTEFKNLHSNLSLNNLDKKSYYLLQIFRFLSKKSPNQIYLIENLLIESNEDVKILFNFFNEKRNDNLIIILDNTKIDNFYDRTIEF